MKKKAVFLLIFLLSTVFTIVITLPNCYQSKVPREFSPYKIADIVKKSVVIIYSGFVEKDLISDDEVRVKGTGFVFDEDESGYYILTNLHVLCFKDTKKTPIPRTIYKINFRWNHYLWCAL